MVDDEGNGGDVDLLISDIQHNQSENRGGNADQEDIEQLMKTGGFTKEMMGQTIRDLGSTIKDAKSEMQNDS